MHLLKHYLTVAFRNLWKYKSQSVISILGLAVGFTCFALATLWIRYEMTYDSFHREAKRIYCINIPDSFSPTGMSRETPYPMASYMKATFPEIAEATVVIPAYPGTKVELEGIEYPAAIISVDSTFFPFFDVRIIEGNRDFLIPDSKKMAITQEKARQLFGKESPIGKEIKSYGDYTICAVVTGLSQRSNYPFDFLQALTGETRWNYFSGENTLIRLAPGIDPEVFKKKLYEHEIDPENRGINKITKMTLTPLTQLRYTDLNIWREVQFKHILIFALSGSLLILCTLFNYLTLFISRFRIRQKELALRKVCGASTRSLFALLSVEFSLSLFIALLLGLIFIQLLHEPFQELSEIKMELSSIYGEALLYIGAVVGIALFIFWLLLAVFWRRTLNAVIRRGRKNHSRKLSVIVQLLISIGFAFCTIVILKQMYYLHHTDLGFSFKNSGSVMSLKGIDVLALENQLKQVPEIMETVSVHVPLLPMNMRMMHPTYEWAEMPEGATRVNLEQITVSEQYLSFYELRLVAGELLLDSDPDSLVLISESAMKALGWNDAIGKTISPSGVKTVKGVIKDVYNLAPTASAQLYYCIKDPKDQLYFVLFRYKEGTWKTSKEKIETIIRQLNPDIKSVEILNTEEQYDAFLKSENALLKMLSLVSLVCVLICVFGFVSLISLACEERRKEMALRKISGATIQDILSIFIKEHLLLLMIGSIIAFPVSYFIMKTWLEQYVVQTSISAWIYLVIIFALAFLVALCVGWRVYKASVENPAEVIKTE